MLLTGRDDLKYTEDACGLYANTTFYTRDLSILQFWCLEWVLEPIPVETEG